MRKTFLSTKSVGYYRLLALAFRIFFKLLEEAEPPEKSLTPKQEEYFVKNPNAYFFFHQLLELDLDWKKLRARHGLTQKSVDSYLLALDKIGVLELHSGNKVKSEFGGNCRLSFGMKLIKLVVDEKHRSLLEFAHIPNEKFRGRKHLANGTLSLKKSTAIFSVSLSSMKLRTRS